MGADLYLRPVFEPNRKKWEGKFNETIKKRDACEKGALAWNRYQQEAHECFNQMYAEGYFRDSYNSSNLLWKFGLSWWTDVIPMLDEERKLTVN